MTLEEAIKNFEQEIVEFEGLKKIHAVTHEDYAHIEKTIQLAEWLRELKERREIQEREKYAKWADAIMQLAMLHKEWRVNDDT